MPEEQQTPIDELFGESSSVDRGSPRPLATFALIVVGYALVFACLAASIAFFEPEDRAKWSALYTSMLFPFGGLAFDISQTVGGFLQIVSGVQLANLGAAVPLFIAGLVCGFIHASVVSAFCFAVVKVIGSIRRNRARREE